MINYIPKDKYNKEIKEYDIVSVPEPEEGDRHNYAFTGTVVHIMKDSKLIMVEHLNVDVFIIDPRKVIIKT